MSYGANFLLKDDRGMMPIHWAAAKVHIEKGESERRERERERGAS